MTRQKKKKAEACCSFRKRGQKKKPRWSTISL